MSQIAQVQITFIAAQDRLLMRLATDKDEEFRFWLTRRFAKALRPQLGDSLTQQPKIQTQASPEARRELLKFEHEQAVSAADFKTPYRGAAKSLPLGDDPVLLTRFQLRPQKDETIILSLGPEHGAGIDLALKPPLLHSVVALMDAAIRAADWDLDSPARQAQMVLADSTSPSLN